MDGAGKDRGKCGIAISCVPIDSWAVHGVGCIYVCSFFFSSFVQRWDRYDRLSSVALLAFHLGLCVGVQERISVYFPPSISRHVSVTIQFFTRVSGPVVFWCIPPE